MAESIAEVGKTAKSVAGEAIHASVSYCSGRIAIVISSNSVQVVRDVCITAVSLSALYAGYKLLAKKIDGAITKGLGGDRDDQEIKDIKPGSLHVELHCFTDQRLVEVLEDFECGKMKERLQQEFLEIGIELGELKVEIENIEEVKRKTEIMYEGLVVMRLKNEMDL